MRKQTIAAFLLGAFIFGAIPSIAASQEVKAFLSDIKIKVNGKALTGEDKPIIYNNKTYVPARVIAEALGKDVAYNQSINEVQINDKQQQGVSSKVGALITPEVVTQTDAEGKVTLRLGQTFEKGDFRITLKEVKEVDRSKRTDKVTEKELVYEIVNMPSDCIPGVPSFKALGDNKYSIRYVYNNFQPTPWFRSESLGINITWDIDLLADM